MAKNLDWASDVLPSLPAPITKEPVIEMGGFTFTSGGLSHGLTHANFEDFILRVVKPSG